MKNEPNLSPASAEKPVTIIMDLHAFFRWLSEVQGIENFNRECNDPDFLVDEVADPNSPYCQVAAYLNTAEGTVIARHLRNSEKVEVTMRETKPGPQLMRTVRWMLGEEGEAA